MARTHKQLMTEWHRIRIAIENEDSDSSPSEWFEQVLCEQESLIADLVREISRLRYFEESERKRRDWCDEAKRDAGYPITRSFDDVWADALAALREKRDERLVR